jgi:hypothetical protein
MIYCRKCHIFIIIWISLYVLSVHFPTPPKPAGLDPKKCRKNFYYMRKSLGINLDFFCENAERSGATSESK